MQKNNNRFKIKVKKIEKKIKDLHRTAKAQLEAEVYNNNKKCD